MSQQTWWPFAVDTDLEQDWVDGDDAGDDSPGSVLEGPVSGWMNRVASAIKALQTEFGTGSTRLSARVTNIENHRLLNGKGVIVHGSNASQARPTSHLHASYEWIGSVQPTNAAVNDTWVNTAP